MQVDRRIGLLGVLGLAGCGDSLYGGWAIEERIGSPPLPERASWEVRWVQPQGLAVGCERVDAQIPDGELALLGVAQLPEPTLPEPRWVDGDGFRWAVGLPTLVWDDAPYPELGEGWLDDGLGVWGTTAPLAWLAVDGDLPAAGAWLRADGAPAEPGWVELFADLSSESGQVRGALAAVDPSWIDGGLWTVALDWSEDDELAVWSGWALGGVVSTCGDP